MFCNNVFSKTSLKLKNPRTHPTLVGKYSASKNFYGRVDFFLSEKSFFFQAEDGIRDYKVTEVQTCALPISQGLANRVVAKQVRCSVGMVNKWRSRYLKERLQGLYDEPRPGAPRKITDAQVEEIVIQTLESTPRGQT